MIKQRTLADVWDQQLAYNERIKHLQAKTSEEWMSNYILGTVSELGELLREIQWKSHRSMRAHKLSPNVMEELADITKYVLSMWQVLGVTETEMLHQLFQKGEVLEQLLRQETCPAPVGEAILMLDLDGVVADFRQGFLQWLKGSDWAGKLEISDKQIGLHLDLNNGWNYTEYEKAKLAFEQEGGYNRLPTIKQMVSTAIILRSIGWKIIVYTARPYSAYRRIWRDTWLWLQDKGIQADELHFGYGERVQAAQWMHQHNLVVALEDDPTLIRRYASSSIPVFVVTQPYNMDIAESNFIRRVDNIGSSIDMVEAINAYTFKQGEPV